MVKAKISTGIDRYKEALASYDRTLAINNQSYDLWYGRAKVLTKLNRLNEAVESFEKSLQLNPSLS